jgi:glycosyltransferase involved in cell wall biosynthesis
VISVCIPVHIVHPNQLDYLKEAIHSVWQQEGVAIEICISDDTGDPRIAEICSTYTRHGAEIRYHRAKPGIGLAANINSAVSMARGDMVKILFQDDYLNQAKVLKGNARRLKFSKSKWLVTGTLHLDQTSGEFLKPMLPSLNKNFLDGVNTFSSPSVAIFYRECFVPFDTRLSYLVDCEWYFRMIHNFGSPVLRKSLDIVNRLHDTQATHDFKHLLGREIPVAKSSHSALDLHPKECSCVSRNESRAQSVI